MTEVGTVAQEVAAHALNEGVRERWGHFARWCEAQGLVALPTEPGTLLLYVHAHYPRWRHSTAKSAVSSVVAVNRHNDWPSPRSGDVRRYLKILKTDPRIPPPGRKTDALDARRVPEAILRLVEPELDEVAVPRAALLALALASGQALSQVVVDPASVTRTAFDTRVTLPDGTRVILGKDRAHLRAAVEVWAGNPGATSLASELDRLGLAPVFRRAGLPMPGLGEALVLPIEDQEWLLRAVDPMLERHLRDRTYALTGLCTALRHTNLARLQIDDCTVSPGSISLRIGPRKNDPQGQFGDEVLVCADPQGRCGLYHCGACALGEWLIYLGRLRRPTSDPLFATVYGGRRRRMTRQNGRLVLRAIWQVVDENASIATRSMRSGAVTAAFEAGLDIEAIAANVSKHLTLSEAARYLRLSAEGITILTDLAAPTGGTG